MSQEFTMIAGWESDGGLIFLARHPQQGLVAFWEPKGDNPASAPFYVACPIGHAVVYRNLLLVYAQGFIPWAAFYRVGTHLHETNPQRMKVEEARRRFNATLALSSLQEVLPAVMAIKAFHEKYLAEFVLSSRLQPWIEAA